MPDIQLTIQQRLILANQYKILESLYPTEGYEKARKVFEEGFELLYDWYTPHIYRDTLSSDECKTVLDVLSMYEALQHGYTVLVDKTGVDERSVKFPGFDGNNEGSRMSFARFLKDDEAKFLHVEAWTDDWNSHMRTTEMYDRMLPVWKPIDRGDPLTKDQITAIISESIHPENR